MEEIDVTRTKEGKRLFLKASKFAHIESAIFRLVLRGIGIMILGGFLLAYLMSVEIYSDYSFIILLSVAGIVGLYELFQDYQLHSVQVTDAKQFGSDLKQQLQQQGWWVRNNNQRFFFAVKYIGKARNYLYVVYNGQTAYVCPVFELPFPFSTVCSSKLLSSVVNISKQNI